jgi:hypothetical protein
VLAASTLLLFLLVLELRDKLVLKGDREIARQIQFGLLPFEPFSRRGPSVSAAMRPGEHGGRRLLRRGRARGSERIAICSRETWRAKGIRRRCFMALAAGQPAHDC